ncbi:SNO glutamine amidotransferase [Dacryopinax primogenitus]|uniref:glutaminase n=1 Tax=Dacryopinax primogenitus (strain DJM 731) TaxID=1858805 RepID=M5G934_DACPD|nr:SNO glutamine amidotransferase [Dacryopinax primogenitus]EJU00298.1 SNO glutamine amidotransferase [Dacryopinax primogenitus]
MSSDTPETIVIGILALQGAFAEHQTILSRLKLPSHPLTSLLVRTPQDLAQCSALIIPGGESTTIASVAARTGMLDLLKEFCQNVDKPVWGTCAGCILLAKEATGLKKGGQELFGGMGVGVKRNGYGTQLESFEVMLDVPALRDPERPFAGVFIRAPIIEHVNESAPTSISIHTEIVARVPPSCLPAELHDAAETSNKDYTVVAMRQGKKFVTTFHPELTKDDRLHEYFIKRCVLGLVAQK